MIKLSSAESGGIAAPAPAPQGEIAPFCSEINEPSAARPPVQSESWQ